MESAALRSPFSNCSTFCCCDGHSPRSLCGGGEGYFISQVTVHHSGNTWQGLKQKPWRQAAHQLAPARPVLQLSLPLSRGVRLTTETAHHRDHGNSASQPLFSLSLRKRLRDWGGEMAQFVKWFLCKPDHLSFISRTHTKEKERKKETGGGGAGHTGKVPGRLGVTRRVLGESVSYRFIEGPCLKKTWSRVTKECA